MATDKTNEPAAEKADMAPSTSKPPTVNKMGFVHHANVKDDGYDDHWPFHRKQMGMLLHSKTFDVTRGCVILINILLLVRETDDEARGGDVPKWITSCNYALIAAYTIELLVRIAIYREQFFHSWANIADMTIISADCIVETVLAIFENTDGMPSLVILRTFRLLRLGRTHRALLMFPELNIMVLGMRGAIRTIFWGMILLFVVTVSFAILAVQLIHPVNLEVAEAGHYDGCDRCPRAYESVAAASLTFTQSIIAGDSWGLVTVPIIEYSPATFLFFLLVLSVLGMVLLNLIMAVVIDSANQARQETDHQQAEEKEKQYEKATAKLLSFCQGLDKDQSGSLSLDELVSGYDDNVDFEDAMTLLDITQKDMNTVFRIMDEDNSGEVRYDEFVDELYRMKSEDSHTMITFIKFYVQEIQREMREELRNTRELLSEFHVSLKEVLNGPIVASGDAASLKQLPGNGTANKDIAPAIDVSWLQRSHEELTGLMQDMVKNVERSTMVLGNLEHLSPGMAPPSVQRAGEIPLVGKPSPSALSTSLAAIPNTRAAVEHSTDPAKVYSIARSPLSQPSTSFGLRCCGGSESAAHPPTSIV
jgi:hypothetical protein